MTAPRFSITTLARQDRTGFRSGSEPLDRYFLNQVSQDIRRRATACFVAVDDQTDTIAGFFTLSAADIPVTDLPLDLAKRAPRYPTIPVARVGLLAVDVQYQGLKLGSALLLEAAERAAKSEVAVFGVIVDAKDAVAEAFYKHHGFSSYGSLSGKLIAPLKQLVR